MGSCYSLSDAENILYSTQIANFDYKFRLCDLI